MPEQDSYYTPRDFRDESTSIKSSGPGVTIEELERHVGVVPPPPLIERKLRKVPEDLNRYIGDRSIF